MFPSHPCALSFLPEMTDVRIQYWMLDVAIMKLDQESPVEFMVLLMQKALIKHFISSGVQEGQPKPWNVTSLFQWNESDGNANFIQAAVYQLGSGEREKKSLSIFFPFSGENTYYVVLLPWPLSCSPGNPLPLRAALLPPHWFLPPAPPNNAMLSPFPLTS